MKILIVGGRKKVRYIAESLLNKRNKVIIINDDLDFCKDLARKFNTPVIFGNGSDLKTLKEAKVEDFDAVIALTNKDEDNLVICQLAKKELLIKKTLCIVNNPLNVEVFKDLGIDTVISSTYIVSSTIEQMVTLDEIETYLPLNNGHTGVLEIHVKEEYSIVNKQISNIKFPKETIVVGIIRNFNILIPKGDSLIKGGDKLVLLSSLSYHNEIINILTESR